MDPVKLLGIILVLAGIIYPAWLLGRKEGERVARARTVSVFSLATLAVFTGLVLTVNDRVTELTIRGVGTVRAAAEKASLDAKEITQLRERVENQSATVDLVATQATNAKKFSESAALAIEEAEQKLNLLTKAIQNAEATLGDLKEQENFSQLILKAENNDRRSFDRLMEIAKLNDRRFSSIAAQAWSTILEAHSGIIMGSGYTMPWQPGVDPSKFSLEDLGQAYQDAPYWIKVPILE